MHYKMDTQRNPKVVEIVVIILFIIMTTFLIFIGETFFVFLKDNDSISKIELKRINKNYECRRTERRSLRFN